MGPQIRQSTVRALKPNMINPHDNPRIRNNLSGRECADKGFTPSSPTLLLSSLDVDNYVFQDNSMTFNVHLPVSIPKGRFYRLQGHNILFRNLTFLYYDPLCEKQPYSKEE